MTDLHIGKWVIGFQVRLLELGKTQMLLKGGNKNNWVLKSWVGDGGHVNLQVKRSEGSELVCFHLSSS